MSRGRASATDSQSLSISNSFNPQLSLVCSIEKAQCELVIVIISPTIGLAMAIDASLNEVDDCDSLKT